jgi:hypothetical protein
MNAKELEDVKKQALDRATALHGIAIAKQDADIYDLAARYYYTAGGHNSEANECWNTADEIRNGSKS